jgi:hypothetical protein
VGDYDSPSDPSMDSSPEVTISPADNGHVVRWHQRGAKKDEPGRTVKRVAMSADEALGHARMALSGTGKAKSPKRKPLRDGQSGAGSSAAEGDGASLASPAAQTMVTRSRSSSARRRRPRVGGRR